MSRQFERQSVLIDFFQEIACFSYDEKHEFYLDERSLRYYYPPTIGANLSKGFDEFQQLDDTVDDHLDGLLRTIMALEERTNTKCEADIITVGQLFLPSSIRS